jgi:transcriptional regulator with XRE-family HTH domain
VSEREAKEEPAQVEASPDESEGPSVDAIAQRLGEDIRGMRKARGMTLADLAGRTGRSVGFLSQVENGLKKPSVGSLQSISDALGIGIGWFFPNDLADQTEERQYIVRHDQRRRLSYSTLASASDYLGMTDYLLSPNLTGQHALVISDYAPGASSGDDSYGHGGEESGIVLSGIMDVEIDDKVYRLEAGDSFQFESALPHRYHNPGTEVAVVLMALVPIALRFGQSMDEAEDG